jgi:hypothetical protein
MTRIALWTIQVLLALTFLFAGSIKLVTPSELLVQMVPLPEAFVRFIGVCEVLGALGLVLPGLFRVHQELTPLAAAGLVIIMAGATMLTPMLTDGQVVEAVLPLVLGVLAACVAYARRDAVALRLAGA